MKPSGWGIALRVLGVLSTLFAGLGIIGIIGARVTDDYSPGDAVLGSLILVIPPITVAVLLFRGAERVDKWAAERTARRAAQAAVAARPTPPQPAPLQPQPHDESQKAKAAEEQAAKRRQIEAERQAAKEEQEAKRAEGKAARAARRKEREEKRAAAAAAARERAQAEQGRKDRAMG